MRLSSATLLLLGLAVPSMRAIDATEAARMHLAGIRLVTEHRSEADVAAGWALVRQAAEAGNNEACLALGAKLPPQEGTPWLARAANAGDVSAQLALAVRHLTGQGVPADNVLAYYWYRRAAAAGGNPELPRKLWEIMSTEERARAWQLLAGTERQPGS